MKFLVTGACGQLGHDLICELNGRGIKAVGTDICDSEVFMSQNGLSECDEESYIKLDITDSDAVSEAFCRLKPTGVIHCAAWTQVDRAEDDENRETVFAVNVTGTENIAVNCKKSDIPMTYISTDYVFGGKGEEPWEPDCKAFAPLNYYGETKLKGEEAVVNNLSKFFIVRIAWVFGKNGNNFIRTMLKLAENHDHLRVVSDQTGTPTYTKDLARLLADMNLTEKYGFYHATNEGGYISWYDFACEIFREAAELQVPAVSGSGKIPDYAGVQVDPVTTEEYGISKAARPQNSRLKKDKLKENGFTPLPEWQDALRRYLKELR